MAFNLLSRKIISQNNSLASIVSPDVTITSVVITDSNWTAISQTKLNNTGGYIVINGTQFETGCTVYAGSTAGTVTFVSSTQLRVQFGAVTTGNYPLFVSNPNGNSVLYLSTFGFSGIPSWVSDSNLGTYIADNAFAINLSAVSDSNVVYTLEQGSTLPAGTTLSSAGVLTGTITGIVSNTTYNFNIVATDIENQTVSKTFSISVQSTDLYFKNTTLLLNGDTATPTWITDASTNKFSITVVGDTIPTMRSPFSATDTTSGSAYFDGTGDYLSIASNAAFNLGTGDFTIEAWIYATANSADWFIISSTGTGGMFFGVRNSSSPTGFGYGRTGTAWDYVTGVNPTLNTWQHISITRSGTSIKLFLNGTQIGLTQTSSQSYDLSTTSTTVGSQGTIYYLTGYLSNIRVVKGTAVYTSAFTSPTASLTAITNTSLLTLQYFQGENNSRFVDESTNKYVINKTGKVSQGTFSPFSPTGWSNYVDTSYQGISGAVSLIGTTVTTFTAECWIYMTVATASGDGVPCLIGMDAAPSTSIYLGFGPNASRQLALRWFDGGSKTATGGTTIALNTWVHIAVVSNSNAISMYVNGVAETLSGTTTLTNRNGTTSQFTLFHNSSASAYQFKGYVSDIRVTTTAVYTGAFTPTTTPLTAVTGTVLLTAQSNQFVDTNTQTSAKALTMIGTPSVQAFSPYAPTGAYSATTIGGSGYFNYSGGGYLKVPVPFTTYCSTTGAWTWECWAYPLSFNGPQYGCPIIASGSSSMQIRAMPTGGNASNLNMYAQDSGGNPILGGSGSSAGTIRLNEWSHIVLQRRAGEFEMFLNGTRIINVNTLTGSVLRSIDTFLWIGASADGSNPYWNGYISGVRIQNGTAKYSGTTITVPSTPASSAGSVICTNFTNTAVIDSTSRNVLETIGDAKVSTVQTKFGNGSIFFDGTGDYLVFPAGYNSEFGSGAFTVEMWVYVNAITGTAQTLTFHGWSGSGAFNFGWAVKINATTGSLLFYANGTDTTFSDSTISAVTWTHIAFTGSGGILSAYKNGTKSATTYTYTSIVARPTATTVIGGWNDNNENIAERQLFAGYLDDIRITKGIARYTANFTAPMSSFILR